MEKINYKTVLLKLKTLISWEILFPKLNKSLLEKSALSLRDTSQSTASWKNIIDTFETFPG